MNTVGDADVHGVEKNAVGFKLVLLMVMVLLKMKMLIIVMVMVLLKMKLLYICLDFCYRD
jgi:hypothetical protein